MNLEYTIYVKFDGAQYYVPWGRYSDQDFAIEEFKRYLGKSGGKCSMVLSANGCKDFQDGSFYKKETFDNNIILTSYGEV